MDIKEIREHLNDKLGVYVELEQDEIKFLLEFAINNILALGAAPYLEENKLN